MIRTLNEKNSSSGFENDRELQYQLEIRNLTFDCQNLKDDN